MVRSILTNKKAQAWSLDVIVASIIFLIGMMILFYYAINYSSSNNPFEELFSQASFSSQLLLLEDEGITTDGKINQSKLDSFAELSYEEQKDMLGIIDDFYFTMSDLNVNGNPVEYIGKNATAENLIKVTRIVFYENKIRELNVYVWK